MSEPTTEGCEHTGTDLICDVCRSYDRLQQQQEEIERLKERFESTERISLSRYNQLVRRANELLELRVEIGQLKNTMSEVIVERDHHEESVQSLDVALGGTGKWSNAYCCFENAKELIREKSLEISSLKSKLSILMDEELEETK